MCETRQTRRATSMWNPLPIRVELKIASDSKTYVCKPDSAHCMDITVRLEHAFMTDDEQRKHRIAELNDQFRKQMGTACSSKQLAPGRYVMTAGGAALGEEAQAQIFAMVRTFSDFNAGNDPHGEHDFGVIVAPEGERVFWKIDYFADAKMEYGSEQPDDPNRSYRALTIMLAAEY